MFKKEGQHPIIMIIQGLFEFGLILGQRKMCKHEKVSFDIHCDNVGLNKDNRMVVLDLGFAFDWDVIYRYFGVGV